MADDTNLEEFRDLWTHHLNDYWLIEHDGNSIIINRDTQLPLMIEDTEIRTAIIQKFIEAGVEKMVNDRKNT